MSSLRRVATPYCLDSCILVGVHSSWWMSPRLGGSPRIYAGEGALKRSGKSLAEEEALQRWAVPLNLRVLSMPAVSFRSDSPRRPPKNLDFSIDYLTNPCYKGICRKPKSGARLGSPSQPQSAPHNLNSGVATKCLAQTPAADAFTSNPARSQCLPGPGHHPEF
jgi:hypothetical protein